MKSLTSLDPAALIAFLLNVLLPLTAVCLISLLAARHLFRHHPIIRYWVCLVGLIGILLSPVVVCIQSKVGYRLVTLSLPEKFSKSFAPAARIVPILKVGAGTSTELRETSRTQKGILWGLWAMLAVWGTGVAWGVLRFARGWSAVSRLSEGVHPWKAPTHVEMLDQLESVLGASIPPVFTSPRVGSPVVVGLFRPRVILPEGLSELLAPAPLRQVLLHECAHVVFRHIFGGVVERVAGLLFWPHPLVHALCRELARSREEVCDNVASQEDGAVCYARTLLTMAQGMFAAPNLISVLALQGLGVPLEERIAGLLGPRSNRMVRVKRWKLWAVTSVGAFALASTAVVRVVAVEAKAKQGAAQVSENSEQFAAKLKAEKEALAKYEPVPTGQHLEPNATQASPAEELAAKLKAEKEYMAKHGEGRGSAQGSENTEGLAAKLKVEKEALATHEPVPTGQHLEPNAAQASPTEELVAKLKAEKEYTAKSRAEAK